MGRRGQDILLGAGVGLMVGILPGLLVAGAVLTWRLGGDLREIDLMTYFRMLPAAGRWPGLPGTAALIGAGVALAFALAGIALLWRPALTSHGTARWAEPGELRRAGLFSFSAGRLTVENPRLTERIAAQYDRDLTQRPIL